PRRQSDAPDRVVVGALYRLSSRPDFQDGSRPMTARRALGWLAVAAAASIVWLTRPFLSALLLGALMAFTLEPVYAALARRTRRPFLASLTTVLASGAAVGGALAAFVSVFVMRAVGVASFVREGLRPAG